MIASISSAIDLLPGQQRGVAAVGDLDLLQHLANDRFDVLVVDLHALEAVNLLDFRHHVFRQCLDAEDFQNIVWIGRAADQIVATLYVVAFLNVDHLRLGHQILDDFAAILGLDARSCRLAL